jgi:hypothetical protein
LGQSLSANSANSGGGIYNSVGGYYNYSTLTVTGATLTANSAASGGGGIYNWTSATLVTLHNSILAANHGPIVGRDIEGPVSSASSYNLVGGGTGLYGIGNGLAGNLVGAADAPIDPRLGPLADNGGPTRTHALLDDSPARGAGDPTSAPPTDQRGLPRVIGGEIDLGAYQSQGAVAGPQVVSSDPDGAVGPPVDHVRLTLNHPIDPTSLTTDPFSLGGPGGVIAVTGVTVVPASGGQQIDVSFAPQTQPGDYALTVGGGLRDSHGTPLAGPQTVRFIVAGTGITLTVNSTADTASDTDPYLSLREAIRIVNSPTLPTDLSPQILAQISGTLHANGSDLIAFDPAGVTGPIRLTGTPLELSISGRTTRVTIDGGGGVTVDGNNASEVLQLDPGVQAVLAHLTITHGGSGISNAGTLTVTNSTLSANGCGDYRAGNNKLSNSYHSANSALSAGG